MVLLLLVTGGVGLANLTSAPATSAPTAAQASATLPSLDQGPRHGEPPATVPASRSPSPSPTPSPSPSPSPSPEPEPSPTPAAEPEPEPELDRNPDRESRRRAPAEPDSDITALEDEVTALTNAERRAAGCGEVTTDERLRAAARGHSQDMAANDYFSHTSLDGSTFVDRAQEQGYPSPAAENIAYGYATPADVVAGWMNSDGHRRNILNCSHRTIGVGLAYDANGRPYWTQVFGR